MLLQSAVNAGVLIAILAGWALGGLPYRYIFLVGILPAFLTLWIRRSVPEPPEWAAAHAPPRARREAPGLAELFGPKIRRTTFIVVTVCACGLTAHWALMFWHSAHLRSLAQGLGWEKAQIDALAQKALYLLTIGAIIGNFAAERARALDRATGFSIVSMLLTYFGLMMFAYGTVRDPADILSPIWLPLPRKRLVQDLFALFTMCLPPLFPYAPPNDGRGVLLIISSGLFAAAGTIVFGLFAKVGAGAGAICDLERLALLFYAGLPLSSRS